MLLTTELEQAWLSSLKKGELNPEITQSAEWEKLVNHPQIFIYQTGKLDATMLGGTKHYGKLHAKFLMGDTIGFVGTSNFDYRSILYNNEMGFFFNDPALAADVHAAFDQLAAASYLWGSPEWLQLRKAVRGVKGMKGRTTKNQRTWYKLFKNTGIIWLL